LPALLPTALLLVALGACGRASERQTASADATGGSTTVVAPAGVGSDPSPVPGLSASDLRTVVEAPGALSTRALPGPVADPVVVGGRTVWRVTVPGTFTVRDARVVVEVGGRPIGQGVLTPDLGRLVAATADPAGLVAGAPVAYRYEGGPSVPAGNLAVRR
jgi:hypothetical protein